MSSIYPEAFVKRYELDLPLVENRRFAVKFAVTRHEMDELLAIRREIFRRGRDGAADRNDRDEFDDYALHMMLLDREKGKIAGAYRAIPGELAAEKGFYTASEYDLTPVKAYDTKKICELGRSCVLPEYRTGIAIMHLWSALYAMKRRFGFRYLLGCASVDKVDVAEGYAYYRFLRDGGNLFAEWQLVPCEAYKLDMPPEEEVQRILDAGVVLPPLLKGYLRAGAKIAGAPALDRDFHCIDFPAWFDFENLEHRYDSHFGGAKEV